MSNIVFELWIEDFFHKVDRYDRFIDYEEAQHTGMCIMNKFRKARNWHVTVAGQRPAIKNEPIPYSLERYHKFNERIPV
tara:strand:- start:412 stop:648 length:237 start_codon:yes stop_codon:yes gene_type:complete